MAIINQPRNFFKHADRDPDEVIEFQAETLPFWIQDCVRMYARLTGRMLREGIVFNAWFMLEYPQFLKPGPFAEHAAKISRETVDVRTRPQFLQLLNRAADLWPNAD